MICFERMQLTGDGIEFEEKVTPLARTLLSGLANHGQVHLDDNELQSGRHGQQHNECFLFYFLLNTQTIYIMTSPQSPLTLVRATQRAPRSCITCAKRRVKCDKNIPCQECISRGIEASCKRETVKVKGKILSSR